MKALDQVALNCAVFLPIIGALFLAAVPRGREIAQRFVALATAAVTMAFGVFIAVRFHYSTGNRPQFEVNQPWISAINSHYHVFVDGISLPLLLLSMLTSLACVAYSWKHIPSPSNAKAFLALLLILETGVNGTFVAQDLILFFVFFEVVLLPMYFLIGVWGGANRNAAALKFFIYTVLASTLMLIGFLGLYFLGPHTFDIPTLASPASSVRHLAHGTQLLLFGAIAFGFAVKTPLFPFHTWMPDAHTEAPTVASVLLAGVLLKLGVYGFIRIALPILPDAAKSYAVWIGVLSVIGIIYGALACLAQTDMKRLVAYSSLAHMGFVMLGVATLSEIGLNAAIFGMVAHGLISGMLFFLAGSVQFRFKTRELQSLGGLLTATPRLAWILGFTAVASLGLPGLAGFWGEFSSIVAAYDPAPSLSLHAFRAFMVVAAVGVVLAAGYLLWMYQRVAFGETTEIVASTKAGDVTRIEGLAWAPLIVLILTLGFCPALLLDISGPAVRQLVEQFGSR